MYLFYFLLGVLIFFGAKAYKKSEWNEEYTSLGQTKMFLGLNVLTVSFHHMAQKTCAPWHPAQYMVHGLDFFLSIGYLMVAAFLFCSGLGLYKSYKKKENYLKGFVRKRVLTIVAVYYISEVIYLIVRLIMGEKMTAMIVIWYLSGLHMSTLNSWYIIAIVFFYLVFYLAFRFCKKEGIAILLIFIFTLLYTLLGVFVGHQNDWWMRGEWWYNSILLFPLGIIFAKYEEKITAFFKKIYVVALPLSFILLFVTYGLSLLAQDVWGYYGEYWGDQYLILHRLGTAASQWLVCIFYVMFSFLFMMKVKIGNRALAFLGSITLEYYLMHGMFVELFGYNFLDISPSIVYIRNVPLYVLVVVTFALTTAMLFRFILKKLHLR